MNKKVIYLVRHGEIEYSGEKAYIGISDIPLSIKGISQARRLKEYFNSLPIDKIYSSDLTRTVQTSKIISENRSIEIEKLKELREINMGDWEGKTFKEIRTRYPEMFKNRMKTIEDFKPLNGESFRECQARVKIAFDRILTEEGDQIIITAHAGVNRTLLADILGMPLKNIFRFQLDYGGISKIVFDGKQSKVEFINSNVNLR